MAIKSTFISFPSTKGAILAIAAALSLSVGMALSKKITPDVPTSLIVFMRTFFGLVIFIPFLIKNYNKSFKTKRPLLHALRVAISISAMLCTYYAYRHLPLGFSTSLGMTGGLFTTTLSILFLKETVSKLKWICLLFGYLGVLCIVKPHTFNLEIAVLVALLANLLAGFSIIIVRVLSQYDSTITIMLYNNIGIFIISALLNLNGWQSIALKDLGLLALIAILGLCAQYFFTSALRISRPSFLAPFEYTRLLFSFMIGFIFYSEVPDLYTLFGSLIIIGAAYTVIYQEQK